MIWVKKLDSAFFAKCIIFLIFAYFCIEYKTFEHRLYHIIFKIASLMVTMPAQLSKDYPFFLSDILIFLGFVFVLVCTKNKQEFLKDKASLLLLFFVIFTLISVLNCPYKQDLSRLSRAWSLFFGFLLFISLKELSKDTFIKHILFIICVIAAFETFTSIYQYFSQKPIGLFKLGEPKILKYVNQCAIIPSFYGKKWIFELFKTDSVRLFRSYGTFSHPNVLSCFLMTSILSCTYFWINQTKLKKFGIGLFIFFQITALILTFSRAGITTTFLTFWGTLFFIRKINLKSKIFHGFIFSMLFLANVIVFYPVLNKRGCFSVENKFSKGSNQERANCNLLAFRIIKKHYLLGIGLDHFIQNAHNFKSKNENFKVTSTIHNIYLLIAAEMGLIGLLLFLAFLFSIFVKLSHLNDDLLMTLTMIFVGYLIIGMADYYFILMQKGKIMFFGVAGLIYGYANYLQSCKLAQSDGSCSILYSKELTAKC